MRPIPCPASSFRSLNYWAALGLGLLCACMVSGGSDQAGSLPSEVTAFAARKEAQAKELAAKLNLEVHSNIWAYFKAARQGDWPMVSRLWEELKKQAGQYEGSKAHPAVTTEVWQTVLETELACEQLANGEPEYAFAFGRDIIQSLPPGSIYFGGTDPGRGLVTLLCRAHERGDPFFTLTQNALADGNYLSYLRSMYGGQINIPTTEDSQNAFAEYLKDAQVRLREKRLKPGEEVRIVDNRVQVSGQTAVMAINGLLAKKVFDQNPDRRFFIEESFPLDWMYPHLAPHGLIMELRREPIRTLTSEEVAQDQQFWRRRVEQMLGDWLKPGSPVSEVCAFAERVFVRKDLAGFGGDPKYIGNTNTCAMFSKLRSSIAGIYAWRAGQSSDPAEKSRMVEAADLAFRQAFALCPYSPEAVFRYVSFLESQGRQEDRLRVAQTALKVEPANPQFKELTRQPGKANR